MKTRITLIMYISILATVISGCSDKSVELTGFTVSPTFLSLELGGTPDSQQITITTQPENATDVTFIWSTGDKNVATVSQTGLVTAAGLGSTKITVVANGQITTSVPVVVSKPLSHLVSPEKNFITGIFVPPQPHLLTNADNIKMRFKQIADAGMNLVWGFWTYGSDNEITPAVLDACEENGIGFLLHLSFAKSGNVNAAAELNNCLVAANKYKDHPAVHGFNIVDEPDAAIFDRLASVRREIDAILPEGKYAIANLFPNTSPDYETYVEDYMQKVQPQVLSFDHYPLRNGSDNDRGFVSNLITIHNASIKYRVPFWGFIQSIGWNGMREPTLNEYRWLCNTHIAFGAKGFSYFLYAMPYDGGGEEGFTNSMITWEGNTTHLYDYAKNINREFSKFSDKFMPFIQDGFIPVNQDEQINQAIPTHLKKPSYGNLRKIETAGKMLNGCFDNLKGQKAVYLFNWSKNSSMSAKLIFDGTVNVRLWGKDGLETEQSASELTVSFIPGEAKFLIFM